MNEYFWHTELGRNDLALYGKKNSEDEDVIDSHIIFNNNECMKVKDGINFFVWDNFTGQVVDIAGYNALGNYNCIR